MRRLLLRGGGILLWWAVLARPSAAADLDGDFNSRVLAAQRFHQQGDYASAEKVLKAALNDSELFAADESRKAVVLNNLGSTYHFLNRFEQAEQCYRRAMEIEGRLWGSVEDRPIKSALNLAALYIETGEYAKAERLKLGALAAGQSAGRRRHRDFARLLMLSAHMEQRQGENLAARRHVEEALGIFEQVAGEGAEVVDALNSLCVLYGETGRADDALAFCERGLKMAESGRGIEPAVEASLLVNAGTFQFRVSGRERAEPYYARAMTLAEGALGSGHPLFAQMLFAYADFLESTSRKPQARQCRRRAEQIVRTFSLGESNRQTVDFSTLIGKSRGG